MTELTHDILDGTIAACALWAILSLPIAILLGKVIHQRDQR
ncbi:MAG: hypothetical protein JWQ64_3406 [Subtercola sp.]|jgi:hypothetical protein|nr:hypothetical protein [Subtercola sp.]